MTVGLVVLIAVFVALLAGFIAFYVYSGTEAWHSGETRAAALGFLISIAPFFGGRVPPPKPEIPAAMTPGPEQEEVIPSLGGAGSPDGPAQALQAAPGARRPPEDA